MIDLASDVLFDSGRYELRASAREGLVIDEGVIVEIVRPGTGTPVPDGEVGEVVQGRPGGAVSLAVGMAKIFSALPGMRSMMAWIVISVSISKPPDNAGNDFTKRRVNTR